MMRTRQDRNALIRQLAAEAPRSVPVHPLRAISVWLCISSVLVAGLLVTFGPVRAGALASLTEHFRYFGENVLAAAAVTTLAASAFMSAIPGGLASASSGANLLKVSLVLLVLWFAAVAYGLGAPALPPSMVGKRDGCAWDVVLFGLPALGLGLIMLRRWCALNRARTGALLGAGAGALAAALMQFTCMYVPIHMLKYHMLPALGLVPLGAVAGALVLPRR